jgi:hypothetical protein
MSSTFLETSATEPPLSNDTVRHFVGEKRKIFLSLLHDKSCSRIRQA